MRSSFPIAAVLFSLLAPLALAQTQGTAQPGRHVIIIPPSDAQQGQSPDDSQSAPTQSAAQPQAGDGPAADSAPPPSDGTPPPKVIVVTPQVGQAAPTNVGKAGQRIIVVPPSDQLPQPEQAGTNQSAPKDGTDSAGTEGANETDQTSGSSADPSGAPEGTSPSGTGTGATTPSGPRTESLSATPAEPDAPTADQGDLTPGTEAPTAAALPAPEVPLIEGHPRYGPFLSGPGSLTFMLHHTLMGATGGFVTQGISNNFRFDTGSREAMLAGTLVGAGAGFGVSSWWQFHHYVGKPAAYFGLVNSLVGGMAVTGLFNLTTEDSTALAWSSVLGAELGAWLTVGVGGGDFPVDDGLLITSGEGWGMIYGALTLAMVRFSGSAISSTAAADTLLIAPGIGATLLAFATTRFHPSRQQILRANIAGAAIGGAVLLLSALVLGHLDIPTPYLLSMLSSSSAMAIVSVFWADPPAGPPGVRPGDAAPYRSLW